MTLRQQKFTSPGTWTWPGSVNGVEVFLVGGGGGGHFVSSSSFRAGGGGGVRTEFVTVNAPVPITVGAGGAGGPSPVAAAGGTTSFGPISVGGGGRGNSPAPPTGGGGGSIRFDGTFTSPGLYGIPASVEFAAGGGGVSGVSYPRLGMPSGVGDNYGAGGFNTDDSSGGATPDPAGPGIYWWGAPSPVQAGVPGSGAGGFGDAGPACTPGQPGCVIVRWFE